MKFFAPNPSGEGKLPAAESETAWQACWKAAETDIGRTPLGRRVYRLDYEENGRALRAIVGEPAPPGDRGLVTAIIAFPGAFGSTEADCYSIQCSGRGDLEAGDSVIVGCEAVRSVEDFD